MLFFFFPDVLLCGGNRCFLCNNISILDRRSACTRELPVCRPHRAQAVFRQSVLLHSPQWYLMTRLWNTWCLRFLLSHCCMNRVESNLGSGLYFFTNKWTWSLANQLISQPLQNEESWWGYSLAELSSTNILMYICFV